MARRIAIAIGHSPEDGGAVRVVDGVQEYGWNRDLANMIHDCDPKNIEIFHRRGDLPYSHAIAELYQRIDDWGCDLSIELHFNAFNSRASYTVTLSSGSRGSLVHARAIQAAMVETLGLRDAGVKVRNRSQKGRGYLSLVSGRAPAVLVEPYFGDNPSDCAVADRNKRALARAIYRAARSVG